MVWNPNMFFPKLLGQDNITPLLDNTHTPRGARKAITLERTFNLFPWMYNRNHSELFQSDAIKNDKKKATILKKQIRQKRKMLSTNRTGFNITNQLSSFSDSRRNKTSGRLFSPGANSGMEYHGH